MNSSKIKIKIKKIPNGIFYEVRNKKSNELIIACETNKSFMEVIKDLIEKYDL